MIEQRTAKANQIRVLVSEYGLVAPKDMPHLRTAIPDWLGDAENGLAGRFRRLPNGLWSDLLSLDQRVKEPDQEITVIAANDPVAQRLQQLRGVGPMVATALLATVGDASQLKWTTDGGLFGADAEAEQLGRQNQVTRDQQAW